jgi:hypothetical protein
MKPHESLFDGYLIANAWNAIQSGLHLHKHLQTRLISQNQTVGFI